MSSRFQGNAIIAGYINSYCLVCECFFETEEDTISHIIIDEHKTKLQCYPYLEKYGNNGIRKVKAGYFCDYCSRLMPTAAKVNLHISEKLHYYNKGNSLLKLCGSDLSAFNDVTISSRAWHSITDDTCALCNVEFDDENHHKMERSHLLKLIQNKVEFGDSNNLYRKIDKNDFQCLTCNCVLPIDSLEDHFNDDDHQQMYALCQDEKTKFDLRNVSNDTEVNSVKTAKPITEIVKDAKSDKVKEVKYQNSDMTPTNDNIETMVQPNSKIESFAGNKSVDTKELTKHKDAKNKYQDTKIMKEKTIESKVENQIKSETSISKPTDAQKSTPPNEKVVYAKENNLTFKPGHPNVYCQACQKKFPATVHGMKEHVSGRGHINKTEVKIKPVKKNIIEKTGTKPEKININGFVKNISTFENTLGKDIIINETFCLPEKSCHMITKAGTRYCCQYCEQFISQDDISEHCMTANHERGLSNVLIIKNIGNEFVREVRPEVYHCGFCNIITNGWSDMECHFKTSEHMASSAASSRRLKIHLPVILAQKEEMKQNDFFNFADKFAKFFNHLQNF